MDLSGSFPKCYLGKNSDLNLQQIIKTPVKLRELCHFLPARAVAQGNLIQTLIVSISLAGSLMHVFISPLTKMHGSFSSSSFVIYSLTFSNNAISQMDTHLSSKTRALYLQSLWQSLPSMTQQLLLSGIMMERSQFSLFVASWYFLAWKEIVDGGNHYL